MLTLLASLQGFAIGKKLIEDAFVYHFTAETKPCVCFHWPRRSARCYIGMRALTHYTSPRSWSFHSFYHIDWKLNYHPKMFSSWRNMQYAFHELHPELGDHYALPREPSAVRDQLVGYEWPNKHRQYELCHKYNPKYESSGKFPIQDQYSIAISYYNPERMQYLPKLIRHYLSSDRCAHLALLPRLHVPTLTQAEHIASTPSSSRGIRRKRTSRPS